YGLLHPGVGRPFPGGILGGNPDLALVEFFVGTQHRLARRLLLEQVAVVESGLDECAIICRHGQPVYWPALSVARGSWPWSRAEQMRHCGAVVAPHASLAWGGPSETDAIHAVGEVEPSLARASGEARRGGFDDARQQQLDQR